LQFAAVEEWRDHCLQLGSIRRASTGGGRSIRGNGEGRDGCPRVVGGCGDSTCQVGGDALAIDARAHLVQLPALEQGQSHSNQYTWRRHTRVAQLCSSVRSGCINFYRKCLNTCVVGDWPLQAFSHTDISSTQHDTTPFSRGEERIKL
jgi:hypothetical protein